jgi:hypothetical protein
MKFGLIICEISKSKDEIMFKNTISRISLANGCSQ